MLPRLCLSIPFSDYQFILQPTSSTATVSPLPSSSSIASLCTCVSCPIHRITQQLNNVHHHTSNQDSNNNNNINNNNINNANIDNSKNNNNIALPIVTEEDSEELHIPISVTISPSPNQHRSTSIFAGHGTFIETDTSLVRLNSRTLQSILSPRQWNGFMFTKHELFMKLVLFVVVCTAVDTVFFDDPLSYVYIYIFLVCGLTFCVFVTLMFLHWIDFPLFKMILMRWESMIVLFYSLLLAVTGIWRNSEEMSVSPKVNLFSIIVGQTGYFMGCTMALCSDAIPRTFFPRQTQIFIYCLVGIANTWFWIAYAYLVDDNSDTICVVVCMSVNRLFATSSATLASFWFKFAISLCLWPNDAIILRARIRLEH